MFLLRRRCLCGEPTIGWNAGGTHQLARTAGDGTLLEGPATVQASWGERDDPFGTQAAAGDIVWAWFDQAGATMFHVVRFSIGGGCVPI